MVPVGQTSLLYLQKPIAEDCCCVANISVGYYNAHRHNEYLIRDEWYEAFVKYARVFGKTTNMLYQ